MTASYTVVRYVPDPVRDEAVNIGVVAYDDVVVHSRFVDDWRRVRHFGDEDISYLKSFARSVEAASPDQWDLASGSRVTPDAIREMADSWMNSIQFTEPRATLLSPHEAVQHLAPRFLAGIAQARPRRRTRHYARGMVIRTLTRTLRERGLHGQNLLQRDGRVVGRREAHRFDAVLGGGDLVAAAHGVSFDSHLPKRSRESLDAIKWAVDDIHQANAGIVLGILALSPSEPDSEVGRLYDATTRVLEDLGAEVLSPDSLSPWASRVIGRFVS